MIIRHSGQQERIRNSLGKEGAEMRRLMVPAVLVLVAGLGSYAIFAQQPSGPAPRGMGRA